MKIKYPQLRGRDIALLLLVALLLAGCAGRPLMPTPNLYAAGAREPFARTPPELRSTRVDLLYVTDRVPQPDESGNLAYGYQRSLSMAFGSAIVEIGE